MAVGHVGATCGASPVYHHISGAVPNLCVTRPDRRFPSPPDQPAWAGGEGRAIASGIWHVHFPYLVPQSALPQQQYPFIKTRGGAV